MTREDAIAAETVRVVARRGDDDDLADQARVRDGRRRRGRVQHRSGHRRAAARRPRRVGPTDAQGAARAARASSVGVVVTDTFGRPWRDGQTDTAIGAAGVLPVRDHRGRGGRVGQHRSTSPSPRWPTRSPPRATWSRARRCSCPWRSFAGCPRWSPRPTGPARGSWSGRRTRTCSGSARPTCCPRGARSATFTAAAGRPRRRTAGDRGRGHRACPAPQRARGGSSLVASPTGRGRGCSTRCTTRGWRTCAVTGSPRSRSRAALRRGEPLRDAPLLVVPCLELSARTPTRTTARTRAEREMFVVAMGAARAEPAGRPGRGEPGLGLDLIDPVLPGRRGRRPGPA